MSEVEEQVDEVAAAKERSQRAVDHLAEIWVDMGATDAWQQLERELGVQGEKAKIPIYDDMFTRTEPVDQREVDYVRGLLEGLSRPLQIMKTAREHLAKKDQPAPEPEPETPGAWS